VNRFTKIPGIKNSINFFSSPDFVLYSVDRCISTSNLKIAIHDAKAVTESNSIYP
jgi:hypothetical protein